MDFLMDIWIPSFPSHCNGTGYKDIRTECTGRTAAAVALQHAAQAVFFSLILDPGWNERHISNSKIS